MVDPDAGRPRSGVILIVIRKAETASALSLRVGCEGRSSSLVVREGWPGAPLFDLGAC